MAKRQATARKGGAPRKAPDGLDRVLYVRTDQKLLDKLEELRRIQSEKTQGGVLSKADIVRALLWEGVERAEGEKEEG